MARFTGPVRFFLKGNRHAAMKLKGKSRELINQIGTHSRRDRGANGTRKYRFVDGTTITVTKTAGVYHSVIYVPPKKDKERLGPGAFVIYPYTGWLSPTYRDKRWAHTNILIEDVPSYYLHRKEELPSAPYWLDTENTFDPEKPTKYKVKKCKQKVTDPEFDPTYAQFIDDGFTHPDPEDDHYFAYGHWNDDDYYLHWADSYGGDLHNVSTWGELSWGKFIYVNGVKFLAPGHVRGGAVYHDTETKSDWLVISTWVQELYTDCLYDTKANIYMTRLFTGSDDHIPTATNDGAIVTTTEMYNAIATKDPTVSSLKHDWFPVDDNKDGFNIPAIGTNKESYASDCDAGWPGDIWLGTVTGFKFNQSCNRYCYITTQDGFTASEFNEFTLAYVINKEDDILIPDTFSKTLSASDIATTVIDTTWLGRKDGNWHDYSDKRIYVAANYKGDVLQKLRCQISAKYETFDDVTINFRYMSIKRVWDINDVELASQTMVKQFTGANFADQVWVGQTDTGTWFIHYDLKTDDYVKEEYDVYSTGDVYTQWYKRTIQVENTLISTDEGTNNNLSYLPFNEERPGWPMDCIGKYPWQMHGSANQDQDQYMAGYNNTTNYVLSKVLFSLYDNRIAMGWNWMGGGGPGHLSVMRGHEKGHIMGTYCARSVNAGANGIYFIDTPSPYEYVLTDTDHRFRVAQHIFVFNINNADKLYREFKVVPGEDNTVPLIATHFYRRTHRWDEA